MFKVVSEEEVDSKTEDETDGKWRDGDGDITKFI
jgi:hypothetical protein